MTAFTLFEWERRAFTVPDAIPVVAAARLVRAGEAASSRLSGRPRVFEFGRDALVAQQVVGVVAAGDHVCEILPKIDRGSPEGAPTLRRRLVHMLAIAYDLPVADGAAAALETQNETLLELLIGLFARALADAVRRGMPRRYVAHADDLPALRGRLDVTRQFTTLAAQPQRLACRYDALSPDIALNQVMKAAVTRLARVTQAPENQRRLRELGAVYADIKAVPPGALRWDAVAIDRTNVTWRRLLALARLLLGERFQNTAAGGDEGFALLFEMNTLFERYVAKLLGPVAAAAGLHLTAQGGARHCLRDEAGDLLFQTLPDFQLKRDGEVAMIVDTKWKRLGPADRAHGVSQGDVYQMMAYARLYRCPWTVLLYPEHAGLGGPVLAHHTIQSGGGERLTVATLDVSSHESARAGLAGLVHELAMAETA